MNATTPDNPAVLHAPLRYDPSLEQVADDEAATIDELQKTLLKIEEKTFEDSSEAMRSVRGFATAPSWPEGAAARM